MSAAAELSSLSDQAAAALVRLRDLTIQAPLQALRESCEKAERAWSGSNIGYHATVYCKGLRPKPAEAQFSSEWGLGDHWSTHQPHACWELMDSQAVIDQIVKRAAVDIEKIEAQLAPIRVGFAGCQESAISILSAVLSTTPDTFLQKKLDEIESLQPTTFQRIVLEFLPKGSLWSRDSLAMGQGLQIAPHQQMAAFPMSAVELESAIDRFEKILNISASHLQRLERMQKTAGSTLNPTDDEWISAAQAIDLLGMGYAGAQVICKRAHAGLIKARAERLLRNGQIVDTLEIWPGFWWAKGEAALGQDWRTGDFDTWIDQKFQIEAFGVTFRRSDIERAKPPPLPQLGRKKMTTGKHIFLGHGHSLIWRELKDFLEGRLGLSVDEFNRTATAGIPNADRLKEMLNDASFAFLILTAEDEHADGTVNARLNVVHEAGLFQGRLGFKRAIIMLEEGCKEFSNIHGLGQLRFPKGQISAQFEEIRRVLEREAVIAAS